eukprot:CAMPEP_0206011048 /NCGR_PEP_ID=MMETSP1464-20131121/12588_1 /ASSEMBLY_ACC=CAM_ASM_001124 /TAXON_ID=119497 /ORGANISM="Exanthemachrysis gayraliae, Strain RCC1523" /LENGTH=33 /DNA_ID= /DNA_START= /DNA_END= /DNA_ORIENTATION=
MSERVGGAAGGSATLSGRGGAAAGLLRAPQGLD